MPKIFTATIKELLLLKRDGTGLLTLFVMPALLVIVITLVQENVMQITGQKKTEVLFLDLDKGKLGNSLHQRLAKGNLELVLPRANHSTSSDLQEAVAAGDYQVGIVIEAGATEQFRQNIALLFTENHSSPTNRETAPQSISVFFDPGAMPGFREGVKARLHAELETIAMAAKVDYFSRKLDNLLDSLDIPREYVPLPPDELAQRFDLPVLVLEDVQIDKGALSAPDYNPVQQNVPAWAIFGMFFTAVPIAGTILQERQSGIWIRLVSLPVSQLQLLSGKVLAYICVCFSQFLLVALIGHFLFPHIGLPSFTVVHQIPGVLLTTCFISLAACGLGIVLGMICTSYEQASAVGASFVVTAAAIGGVMVPVYAMPELMQHVSIISPLNWGLNAFQDLLVRGQSVAAITADLTRLAIFFLVTLIFAWKLSRLRV